MRELITSTKNEYIKKIKSLKTKKGRKAEDLFIVDGIKCVYELFEHAPLLIESLIVAENTNDELIEKAVSNNIPVYTVKEHVMEAVSDLKTSQGIAATAKSPVYSLPNEGFILALDDVSDPQNVGTMIRTADAAGCSGVALSANSADFLSPKSVRASMGSIFHIPVYVTQLPLYLEALKENGYRVAAADMHADPDYKYDWKKTCLVIGNEARGISNEISQICTDKISVPMYGKAESLNAAVAAGILIYKIRS